MNRATSILGGLAVVAIAIVFILQFRPAANQVGAGASGPTCAVEVSGHCLPTTEFWAAYRLAAPRGADSARLRAMGLRRLVAEGMLEQWLLTQDAKRLGLTVSEEDLTAELWSGRVRLSLPADKARQLAYSLQMHEDGIRFLPVRNRQTKQFDRKQYEREVRTSSGLSPIDFRDFQKKELLAARMRDLVRSRVQVGDSEAFEQFAREKSTATVDYVRLDRSFYADLVVDPSPKAVAAWAESNKEEVERVWNQRKSQFLPECRVARHVLAKVQADAADPEAAKAEAKKRIEAALARVQKGEKLADVARDVSDDGSASKGGDLGCVAKGRMVKPFEDALFSLDAGKVSGIVETEYGYHLIEVERIAKEADAEALGRSQTSADLYARHESERLAAEAAKQILAAVQSGKTLAAAVETHLAEVEAKIGGGKGKAKAKAAKKKEGDAKGKKDAVAAKKPEDAAQAAGDGAKEEEKEGGGKGASGSPIETHPARPQIVTSSPFSGTGEPIPGAQGGLDVARIAFELQKPGDVPNDVVPLENGYAVMQLKEKTPASKEQWEKDREFYLGAMRAAKQADAVAGYMRQLKSRHATEVKYAQSLVTEPKDDKGEQPPPIGPEDE